MSTLEEIQIRTELMAGDIGAILQMHATLYSAECGYGLLFEAYVAQGLAEFCAAYDPGRDRVWICEHGGRMIGSLLLAHRPADSAQLRYFLIRPEYRGIGLGKRLMDLWLRCWRERGYKSAFLWTVDELPTAAALYRAFGFELTEEKPSTAFGKPVREQRYELVLPLTSSGLPLYPPAL